MINQKTTEEILKELDTHVKYAGRAEKDFDETMTDFVFDEPFYSAISRQIHKSKTEEIPTAAVFVDESLRYHLKWNEKFWYKLKWYMRQELLKHEYLHLIFNHCTTRVPDIKKGWKNFAWGWATDFAINSLLDHIRLPPGGLMPGEWPELSEEEKKKFSPEEINMLESLGDLIRSFEKKKSADWYYDQLISDPEVRKAMEMLSKKRGTACINIGTLDSHDGWEELDDDQRDIMKAITKQMVQRAIDHCDSTSKWGSVPFEMQQQLRKLVSRQVNWRALLRNFIGMVRSLNHTRSMKRIDRRYPYIHPGQKRGRSSRIAVAIDESGSVSNHEIELFFAELDQLAGLTEFVVVPFDSEVREDKIFTWRRGRKIKPERVTCGGTDFSVPTRWVNKHSKEFDGFIIMTDGACSKPIACKKRRAYIISPRNKLYFETNELVINMEELGATGYLLSNEELGNNTTQAGSFASAAFGAEESSEAYRRGTPPTQQHQVQ